METILEARRLTVEATTSVGSICLVRDADLDLHAGEILGLIGESGSGKTTTIRALMGMLESNARISSGEIDLCGERVFAPSVERFKEVRGSRVGMVFQSSSMSLDPLMRVGRQLREVLRRHQPDLSRAEMAARESDVLRQLGFEDPGRVLASYPHQLSGGMQQRVAIALAVVSGPEVVIADECTSALDVTTQAEVVRVLRSLAQANGLAMIFVTHDLLLAREICHRIAVMYAGEIVEIGTADQVVTNPRHPYTQALLAAIPQWGSREVRGIAGSPPQGAAHWSGCRFAPRCPVSVDECAQGEIRWSRFPDGSGARCLLLEGE